MENQSQRDSERIAEAIRFIEQQFKDQPSLEVIAEHVGLSSAHFQRMFTDWAGVSPKQFLQYITIEHAKKILQEDRASLLQATHKTGLSGSSRLHDLFLNIEGMTPGEYKNGAAGLTINYDFVDTPFGPAFIASTTKGVCSLAFAKTEELGRARLKEDFPNAQLQHVSDAFQKQALAFFTHDWTGLPKLKLHLKGTDFQLKVWQALLKIPVGQLSTYGSIATRINNPKACRAVGTAVGDNPIAFLIPCHRVIQSTGVFGNYHWGSTIKLAMIGWEGADTK